MTIKTIEHKFNKPLTKRSNTNKIIIHHSASKEADASTIHNWHLEKGWAGIGYHYVVRKNGSIETGRPLDTIGAHCTNQNADSIGICCEGNFNKEKMTTKQRNSLQELLANLSAIYGIIPIKCHRDFMATDCPGKNFPIDKILDDSIPQKKIYKGILPVLPFKGYLCRYDQGLQVRRLQELLNWYGDYGLAIDGDFGLKTLQAVKNFQKKEKLKVDGLFGNKSRDKMIELIMKE